MQTARVCAPRVCSVPQRCIKHSKFALLALGLCACVCCVVASYFININMCKETSYTVGEKLHNLVRDFFALPSCVINKINEK